MKFNRCFHEGYFQSVRPECFLSSKNVSKDDKKDDPSIHFTSLCFVKHSGRTGLGIITLTILSISSSILPFSYDSVIYTAQNGDIKSADQQMRSIVVNSPDDADVLYDAGVLAHQLNNYSEAAAYFNRSAQYAADQDKNLCFRAHFNAGNAYVDNKDLRLALEHYDKALAINPDSEFARHNRDRVAQMLQQQEQQQDQQNDDQKNQEDDSDQQDKDEQNKDDQSGNKNDQQNNDSNDDQKQESDQQQDNDSQKNGSDQKSDQKTKGKQGKGSDNNSKREQGAEDGDTDQKQDNSANDKERNGKQKFDKKSERAQNEREKQQGKQHGKAPQQENKTQSKDSISPDDKQEQQKNASKANAQQAEIDRAQEEQDGSQKWDQKIDDPWLSGILDDQELHDKAVNKKLMEARIRQHGGKNGQNCW